MWLFLSFKEIPIKVLDNLDAMTTFDYNSDNDLVWDDSIERNAQDIANELEENKVDSSSSSIIDVNVEDYLRLFPRVPEISSSTPLHVPSASSSPRSGSGRSKPSVITTSPSPTPQ